MHITLDNLTLLEKKVLIATMNFWNYGTRDEKDDNAVIFNVNDLAQVISDMSKNQIKGIVGSLFKKNLFWEMEGPQANEIGITNEGIDLACDLSEE